MVYIILVQQPCQILTNIYHYYQLTFAMLCNVHPNIPNASQPTNQQQQMPPQQPLQHQLVAPQQGQPQGVIAGGQTQQGGQPQNFHMMQMQQEVDMNHSIFLYLCGCSLINASWQKVYKHNCISFTISTIIAFLHKHLWRVSLLLFEMHGVSEHS